MLIGGEGKPDDGIALGRAAQPLLADEGVELGEDRIVHGVRLGCERPHGKLFPAGILVWGAFRIGKAGGLA